MKKYTSYSILLLILFIFSSCVYYNTFFNAKKYFREALEAKKNNQGRVNESVKSKLDKSIQKCAYILKEYPENKWADDALLLIGKCYFEKEKYIQALKKFQEFEQYYQDSELYLEVKLYLTKTHLELYEFEKANNQFSAIFSRERFLPIRDQAYLDFAIYYLEKDNTEKAREMLNKLLKLKINTDSRVKANFLLGEIYYNSGNYAQARKYFQRVVKLKPEKTKILDAKIYIGKTYIKNENYKKASEYLAELEKEEVRKEKIHELTIFKAVNKAHLNDTTAFENLLSELKQKNISQDTKTLINYHQGNIYLTKQNDYTRANEKFDKVSVEALPENLKDNFQIKSKIAELFLQITGYSQNMEYSQLVDTYLQIAETYCLDLNQPEIALTIYDSLNSKFDAINKELDSLQIQTDSLSSEISKITAKIDTTQNDSLITKTNNDSIAQVEDSLLANADKSPDDTLKTKSDSISTTNDSSKVSTEEDSVNTLSDSLISSQKTNLADSSITELDTVSTKKDTISNKIIIDSTLSDSMSSPQDTIFAAPDSTVTDSSNDENYLKNIRTKNDSLANKITQYREILTQYDEIYKPKILFMNLWVHHNYITDSLTQKQILTELEENYPNSKFTKSAHNLLKNQPYEQFFSTLEQGETLFVKSQGYYYDKQNIDTTITLLDSIINNYPESSYYPRALYFKAHLLLTEYSDTTQAKPLLKELIENYTDLEFTNRIPTYFNKNNFILPEPEKKEQNDSLQTSPLDSTIVDSSIIDTTYDDSLGRDSTKIDTAREETTLEDTTFGKTDSTIIDTLDETHTIPEEDSTATKDSLMDQEIKPDSLERDSLPPGKS